MRRVLMILAALALLWCGWWAIATWSLSSGAQAWFEARRAEGWQAELADATTQGFPSRIETVLEEPALTDPDTGLSIRANALTISARAIWPGDLSVLLPETPIRVATPVARWTAIAEDARAELNLHPGTALELEGMRLVSAPFRIEEANGKALLGGMGLILSLDQGESPESYDLRFDITDFAPGAALRGGLDLPGTWPLVFDVLTAKATVAFDTAIDRTTLEDRRPQPQSVLIDTVDAHWGDMRLRATGEMLRDAAGFAEGHLVIKAENWQRMLDMATAAGLLPADFRPQIEGMLGGLASGTGTTNELDVTLRFEGGMTRIGFIPLGPAPRLVIR